jgi:predicted nucleic acid-binding protein
MDDNKFVDCAIAGNADYLVSNDKHFNCLKNIEFPKLNLLNIDEFMDLLVI